VSELGGLVSITGQGSSVREGNDDIETVDYRREVNFVGLTLELAGVGGLLRCRGVDGSLFGEGPFNFIEGISGMSWCLIT
jgi:hypothetical protein